MTAAETRAAVAALTPEQADGILAVGAGAWMTLTDKVGGSLIHLGYATTGSRADASVELTAQGEQLYGLLLERA